MCGGNNKGKRPGIVPYEDSMDYFSFPGPADIEEAFPESQYAGQPIRDLIAQPDPEDPSRRFLNFFEATLGRASVEFITLQSPSAPASRVSSVTQRGQ